jgi:membrane dipeptidase
MIIDAHCDTALKIYEESQDLYKNNFHVDLQRLDKPFIQFFAAFVNPDNNKLTPFNKASYVLNNLNTVIQKYNKIINKCVSYSDIKLLLITNLLELFYQ